MDAPLPDACRLADCGGFQAAGCVGTVSGGVQDRRGLAYDRPRFSEVLSTELNFLRLSTQVPARAVHTALKEAGFRLPESGLIVHALKSLGQQHVTPEIISTIRTWLAPHLRATVLADAATAAGWVYAAVRQIAGKEADGSSRESARGQRATWRRPVKGTPKSHSPTRG